LAQDIIRYFQVMVGFRFFLTVLVARLLVLQYVLYTIATTPLVDNNNLEGPIPNEFW